MSKFINAGAKDSTNKRFKTKKAMREAIAADPASVTFDPTSMFESPENFTADNIPAGKSVSVVGPDPYTTRNWYATVKNGPKGLKVE